MEFLVKQIFKRHLKIFRKKKRKIRYFNFCKKNPDIFLKVWVAHGRVMRDFRERQMAIDRKFHIRLLFRSLNKHSVINIAITEIILLSVIMSISFVQMLHQIFDSLLTCLIWNSERNYTFQSNSRYTSHRKNESISSQNFAKQDVKER